MGTTTAECTEAQAKTRAIIKIHDSSMPLQEEEEEEEEERRAEVLGVRVAWCLLQNGCKYACV